MKTILAYCIFVLAIVGMTIGCKDETKKPLITVTIEEKILDQLEKKRPQDVFAYEIIPGDSRQWLEMSGKLFNMKGKLVESKDLITLADSNRYLEVRKISNALFYAELNSLWKSEPVPDKTEYNGPTNEESQEIAIEWLMKSGFSPEEVKNLKISVSDEIFELTTPDKPDKPQRIITGKNVEVRRTVDNLLVYGPGFKIKIFIGTDRHISGAMAVWPQITPSSAVFGHKTIEKEAAVRSVKPISAKEAFNTLKQNPLDHLPLALVNRIHIEKVEFGYYGRSATEGQKYLQPVYIFYGKAYGDSPEGRILEVPYEQYVLALSEPLEPIWPPSDMFKPVLRPKDLQRAQEKDEDEK